MTETETFDGVTGTVTTAAGSERRLPGLVFATIGAGFLTVTMLAAAMAPGYDFGGGAISDLGVVAETALLFNAGLVVVGVLNIAGGYLLYRVHRARSLFAVYVVAGVAAAGVGLFPLDTGAAHSLFALLAFVAFNVQAIATGRRLAGPMRTVSVLAGLVGLAFVVVMAVGDAGTPAVFGPIGHGGAERMIVYPPMVWLLALGGYLLADGAVREKGTN
jgi:hypothetical membrane protein